MEAVVRLDTHVVVRLFAGSPNRLIQAAGPLSWTRDPFDRSLRSGDDYPTFGSVVLTA
jgi:hypothetical protein